MHSDRLRHHQRSVVVDPGGTVIMIVSILTFTASSLITHNAGYQRRVLKPTARCHTAHRHYGRDNEFTEHHQQRTIIGVRRQTHSGCRLDRSDRAPLERSE